MENVIINKIVCADSVGFMRKNIPSNYIDLTVTSPPYDNLRNYNGYHFDFEGMASELLRVTKPGGVVVWVVGDATVKGSETGTSFKQALYFKEIGFNLHDTMIWSKPNPMPQIKRKRYANCFEYMFIFSKGYPNTCNYLKEPCKNAGKDMSKSSFKNYSQNDSKRYMKDLSVNDEKIKSNIWEFKIGKGSGDDKISFEHPATFPERLADCHILSWSNPGDIVIDPMCGSGTTLKMAKKNGRNYIGIDISSEYIELANKRVKEVTAG